MEAGDRTHSGKKALVAGWILSVLPALILFWGGVLLCIKAPVVVRGLREFGYPEGAALGIGIAELACAILYLIPRTCVLGAILLTGYLGGATATHVRAGQMFFGPIVFAFVAWVGLILRERGLRQFLPLRT